MENPLISIIIPAFNTERYIKKCVESIMAQTYKNIEIIIINDGSTDSTPAIIEDLRKKDNRIIIIHQNNKGIGASRKLGLETAAGMYFQFIDSDDWVDSQYIEKMYSAAVEYNADIVESGGFFWHDQFGNFIKPTGKQYPHNKTLLNAKKVANWIVQRQHSCSLCTKFFKREFCLKHNIRFENGIDFGEDAHFICKLCYCNPVYLYINQRFYHLINNPTSTTKKRYTIKNFSCRISWISDLYSNIEDPLFRQALISMKFFIREESALSQLYSQEEYYNIFPEVLSNLGRVKAGPIRKLFVLLASKFDNKKIGYVESKKLFRLIIKVENYLYQKVSQANDKNIK